MASRAAPRGEPHRPLAQPLGRDHRRDLIGGDRGEQRVEAPHPGVPERGALLGVAVDLDDGVVDVERAPCPRPAAAEQLGVLGEVEQEPRGHRVGLADVPEGERAQKRAQRRGGVCAGEDCPVPGLMEALIPRKDESHGGTEEVPRGAAGAGDPDGGRCCGVTRRPRSGRCKRVGEQLGINPETLRNWVTQAEIDGGHRPGTTTGDAAADRRARAGGSRSCAGRTRS